MTHLKSTIIILILCLGSLLKAQDKSLLWQISKDGIPNSYLYGTMHLQDKRVFEFGDSVMAKFNQSEVFACEVAMDMSNPFAYMALLVEKDSMKRASTILSPEEFERAMSLLNPMKAAFMKKSNINTLISCIMSTKVKKDYKNLMDIDFMVKAQDLEKEIIGLESMESQLEWMRNMPDGKKYLIEVMDSLEVIGEFLEEMIVAYQQQDVDKILDAVEKTELDASEKFKAWNKEMMLSRNNTMMNGITKSINQKSTFIAVGMAHLFGEDGLIKMLKSKGYRVEPIFSKYSPPEPKSLNITKWYTFKSKDNRFSVDLPFKPSISKETTELENGESATVNTVTCVLEDEKVIFGIIYSDPKTSIIKSWEEAIENWGKQFGTIYNLKEIKHQGYEGRSFNVINMGTPLHFKVIKNNDQAILMMYGGAEEYMNSSTQKHFEESLNIFETNIQ